MLERERKTSSASVVYSNASGDALLPAALLGICSNSTPQSDRPLSSSTRTIKWTSCCFIKYTDDLEDDVIRTTPLLYFYLILSFRLLRQSQQYSRVSTFCPKWITRRLNLWFEVNSFFLCLEQRHIGSIRALCHRLMCVCGGLCVISLIKLNTRSVALRKERLCVSWCFIEEHEPSAL